MNPFYQAIDEGFDPEEILKFLSKAIPTIAPMILKAKSTGYAAKEILGFFSQAIDPHERKGMSQSERIADNRRREGELTKRGLKLAASAVALPIAGTVVRNAFARALPSSLIPQSGQGQTPPPAPSGPQVPSAPGAVPPVNGNGISSQLLNQPQPPLPSGQANPPIGPQPQAPLQPSSQQPPVSPSNIPQQALPAQAQQITPNITEILNKHGLTKHIDKLKEKYKDPKEIAAVLYSRFPKEMKQFQDEAAKPMEEAIGDYLGMIGTEGGTKISSPSTTIPEEPEKIELQKGASVISPQGVGEVRALRNGNALVEVDGKLHKVNEDELIQSPIPEKDLADLYDDLIQGIEKHTGKQVSRNVEWAGFDPNTRELAYRPHGAGLYVYDDISDEDIKTLTDLLTQRKSTGENFIGAWEAGTESPIGAAMYQLIQKLQKERGGKGQEYKNKYATIYDAIEAGRTASKEKHAGNKKKKAKKPRAG